MSKFMIFLFFSFLAMKTTLVHVELNSKEIETALKDDRPAALRFFDKCTISDAKRIGSAIARFFFRCNISFRIIDSDAFRQMIKTIRPAYATAHLFHFDLLRTKYLDEEYERVQAIIKTRLQKSKFFFNL